MQGIYSLANDGTPHHEPVRSIEMQGIYSASMYGNSSLFPVRSIEDNVIKKKK